jgi:hypothetical protein
MSILTPPCNLVWLSNENLNLRTVLGLQPYFIRQGPYLEGQELNLRIIARYRRINPLIPGGFITCQPVKYKLNLTTIQKQFLSFDENTGVLSGNITDIDLFTGLFPSDTPFKEEDYFPISKAPNPRRVVLEGMAYVESIPEISITKTFFFDIAINWNSKRRALLIGPRKLDQNFGINGKPASNEQYYGFLQRQGFF